MKLNLQSLQGTGIIAVSALNSSLTSIVSCTGTVIGGTLKTVADTALTAHKVCKIANNGLHLTADRVVTHQQVRDGIKRNNIELEVTEHLVTYGEREEGARERAEKLGDDTIADLSARKDKFRTMLGLPPEEPVAS